MSGSASSGGATGTTGATETPTLASRLAVVRAEIAAGTTRDDISYRVDTSDLDWPLAPGRIRNVFDELTGAP